MEATSDAESGQEGDTIPQDISVGTRNKDLK